VQKEQRTQRHVKYFKHVYIEVKLAVLMTVSYLSRSMLPTGLSGFSGTKLEKLDFLVRAGKFVREKTRRAGGGLYFTSYSEQPMKSTGTGDDDVE